jgi:proteic killer suppression protein
MIHSFRCRETRRILEGDYSRKFPKSIQRVALRKLIQLEIADCLADLRTPPGNRLEALKGKRDGFYSIRVNQQWRLCFRWTTEGACDVEILDYH